MSSKTPHSTHVTAWRPVEALATWWFDRKFWGRTLVVGGWVLFRLIVTVLLLVAARQFGSVVVVLAALLLFENLWYNAGVVVKGSIPQGSFRILALAIVSYISAALCFAVFYATVATGFNVPVGRFDAAYFSFVTAGTIGFGDIVPVSHPMKAAVVVEHLVSLYYFALVLVVAVGLARKRTELPAN